MTKKVFELFLSFFLFSKLVINEPVIPIEDKNNYRITQKAMEILGKVEDLVHKNDSNYDEKKDIERTVNSNNNNKNSRPDIEAIENSGLFQGDVMLTEKQADEIVDEAVNEAVEDKIDVSKLLVNDIETRKKRKINKRIDKSPWNFPIFYYVEEGNQTLIDEALKLMQKETCVRFEKSNSALSEKPGLKFFRGTGCWSYVGKVNEKEFQNVSIGVGCDTIGTVQHEVMHALGSAHEQCRADRDNYVKIIPANVQPHQLHNFDKLDISDALTYNLVYDYGSDMQYRSNSFGYQNDVITMLPVNFFYAKTIGVNAGLSFLDAKLLNSHYCSNICKEKIFCYNGGYQDPNNCRVCKCVEGFDGDDCNYLPEQKKECGSAVVYFVLESEQSLVINGQKDCLYHFRAPDTMRIILHVREIFFYPNFRNICIKDNSLEVKFAMEKTTTGALFCGTDSNISITSENGHVILHYRSTEENNKAIISYQTA